MKMIKLVFLLIFLTHIHCVAQSNETALSGDAFVKYDSSSQSWTLGTKQITQVLQLTNGTFVLKQLKNNLTGTDFVGTASSDEFRFVLDDQLFTGTRGNYELVSYKTGKMANPVSSPKIDPGVYLEIKLKNQLFNITLNYQLFASGPYTPMGLIRKFYTVTNTSNVPQELAEISMQQMDIDFKVAKKLRLHYWQGGGSGTNTDHEFVDSLRWASHTFHSDAPCTLR